LTGGGLIRSAGGWRAIKEASYEAGIRLTSDERILGSSSFVEKTLASVGEDYDQRMRLKASGIDLYPNVAKAGGIQSQASEGEVVVFYFEPSATQDLKSSGFPEG
jgi:putative transposase